MKFTVIFFSMLVITGCNNRNEITGNGHTESPDNTNKEITSGLSGCYLRVLKRDTLALSIQQTGNAVTGKLSFDNYEKDGSTGTVTGTIDGDILKLIYDFQSEGMHSIMEVYFKIIDNALIHGIGEVAVKSDTTYYSNPGQVQYPESNRLVKTACEQLEAKYK